MSEQLKEKPGETMQTSDNNGWSDFPPFQGDKSSPEVVEKNARLLVGY